MVGEITSVKPEQDDDALLVAYLQGRYDERDENKVVLAQFDSLPWKNLFDLCCWMYEDGKHNNRDYQAVWAWMHKEGVIERMNKGIGRTP